MFEEVNTLVVNDTTRVVAYYEDSPEKPDWGAEGNYPAFTIEYLGWYKCVPQNAAAKIYEDNINAALSHWGRDTDMIQRYLRAFFGASALEWTSIDRGTDLYMFDPEPEVKARWLDVDDSEKRAEALASGLEVWGAWGRGEVYTLSLEELRTGVITWTDGHAEDTPIEEREAVETVAGYYGDNEITDEAMMAWFKEISFGHYLDTTRA